MKLFKTVSQKNNLAKTFWDVGKIILTILVIYPLAKGSFQIIDMFIVAMVVILFMRIGFYLDGKGVEK